MQKLYYLKKSVSEEAAELIRGFSLTEAAYSKAWKVLCEWYDSKRQIIHTYLNDLFELQRLKHESGLRKLSDEMDRILRGLKIVGEDVDSWTTVTADWLLSRVDEETRKDFDFRWMDRKKFPDHQTVKKWLANRAAALEERVAEVKESSKSAKPEKRALFVAKDNGKGPASKYFQCFGDHYLSSYKVFSKKTPVEKFGFCREKRLCLRCFSNRHLASDQVCQGRKCSKCDGNHHVWLHQEVAKVVDKEKNINESENASCNVSATWSKVVLMPTAVCYIVVPGRGSVLA